MEYTLDMFQCIDSGLVQ
uniref:Uncharacterized protein n=1 Tax=Rhizophora mucronata TaxID=61149 RepID=A0A2P2QGC1_RHIMU